MDGVGILDSQKPAVRVSDKPKVEKAVLKSTFGAGGVARKKLADITNLSQQQFRLSTQDDKEKAHFVPQAYTKEDQLQKENMALMKMLAERNKIIELTGVELQKLRVNLQKMQQQNHQLAQSNNQLLAELNSSKDRLKALHHELGCKNGLLLAKKIVAEEKSKSEDCSRLDNEVAEDHFMRDEVGDKEGNAKRRRKTKSLGPSKEDQSTDKALSKRSCIRRQSARFRTEVPEAAEDQIERNGPKHSIRDDPVQNIGSQSDSDSLKMEEVKIKDKAESKRPCVRRQSARLKTEVPKPAEDQFEVNYAECAVDATSDLPVLDSGSDPISNSYNMEELESKVKVEIKRPCIRRQSARFKHDVPTPAEDRFEIDDAKFSVPPLTDNLVMTSGSTSNDAVNLEEHISAADSEAQELRRMSLSRPSRQAAKKVQTYKEIPLNVKMRRTE